MIIICSLLDLIICWLTSFTHHPSVPRLAVANVAIGFIFTCSQVLAGTGQTFIHIWKIKYATINHHVTCAASLSHHNSAEDIGLCVCRGGGDFHYTAIWGCTVWHGSIVKNFPYFCFKFSEHSMLFGLIFKPLHTFGKCPYFWKNPNLWIQFFRKKVLYYRFSFQMDHIL